MESMPPRHRLLSCPSCACHVKQAESHCPHCGAVIRRSDGSVPRTAAAVLLGLTAAVNASCGDVAMPEYGSPATGGGPTTISAGGGPQGGNGGEGGTQATGGGGQGGGGQGGEGAVDMPVYGAPATGGGGAGGQ